MTRERHTGGEDGGDVFGRLSDYHDGRYAPGSPEEVEVETLLAENPRYAEILADYRLISDVAKCLREQSCVPERGEDEFAARVREAIETYGRRRVALWTGWGTAVAAAAAIVVAFVLASGVERPEGAPPAGVAGDRSGEEARDKVRDKVDEKAAVLAPGVLPGVPAEAPEDIPAADDPEALRREIEEAEGRGRRMPGVVPVGEGGVSADRPASPSRGVFLGVYVRDVEGVGPVGGVLVTEVVLGSPAALGGIEPGDVITRIGDEAIASGGPMRLSRLVRRAGPGATVRVTYRRGGRTHEVDVVLAAQRRIPQGLPDVRAGEDLDR